MRPEIQPDYIQDGAVATELKPSRARLTAILEETPDFVGIVDAEGVLLFINAAGRKMIGLESRGTLTPMKIFDCHPDWASRIIGLEGIPTALESGFWSGETAVLRPDGVEIPVSQVIVAHRNDYGQVEFLSTILRDITERKRAEMIQVRLRRQAALRAATSVAFGERDVPLSEILTRCSEAIVAYLDAALARIWLFNFQELTMDQVASAEAEGQPDRGATGELLSETANIFDASWVARTAQPYSTNDALNDPRIGDKGWLKEWLRIEGITAFAAFPLIAEGGRLGVLAVFARQAMEEDTLDELGALAGMIARGVEQRRNDEEALRRLASEREARLAAEESNRLKNEETQRLLASEREARLAAEELNRLKYEEMLRLLASEREAWLAAEESNWSKDDEASRLLASEREARLAAEESSRLKDDETSRLLAGEREARLAAEESSRLKDDFLAMLSHDLRAPLTSIMGWIRMLRDGALDEATIDRALHTIEKNVMTQAHLIGDLLDASRIATGKLQLEMKPVDLLSVVETAVDTVRPLIEEKRLKLQMVLEPWVGPFNGDQERLKQVVWNLLTNAIKFTPPEGMIEVRLERLEDKALLIVSDTGQGISPEFLPHIFDLFRQADVSSKRERNGLGLGLAIVKRLVELHGGAIYPYSPGLGQGSDFMVTLPLATVLQNSREAFRRYIQSGAGGEKSSALAGLRVLVVDDEYDTREVLGAMLARYGAEAMSAESAAEALRTLVEWMPDVIVSDIGMPGEDGYEFIARVRALPAEQGGAVPAIALTAFASGQDRQRALSTGFQTHLSKPIEPIELAQAVACAAGRDEKAII